MDVNANNYKLPLFLDPFNVLRTKHPLFSKFDIKTNIA